MHAFYMLLLPHKKSPGQINGQDFFRNGSFISYNLEKLNTTLKNLRQIKLEFYEKGRGSVNLYHL